MLFAKSGGRVAFPTTCGHALAQSGFWERWWGAKWTAARRGRLPWSRAPLSAQIVSAEFGFSFVCEAETLSNVSCKNVCYGVKSPEAAPNPHTGSGSEDCSTEGSESRSPSCAQTWDACVAVKGGSVVLFCFVFAI